MTEAIYTKFNTELILEEKRLDSLIRFSEMMASSVVTLPKNLQGKPADCLAICLQALRWGMDPYIVAGKTYVINGSLGYEAQLVVAVLKNSGAVQGRPHYEYRGDETALECRAGFAPAGEAEILWTEWLAISTVKTKNSPLWVTNPRQQMGYLQARNWARLYAPDALLGVYTEDELRVIPIDVDQPQLAQQGQQNVQQLIAVKASPPALPDYTSEQFEKNLPAWTKLVAGGKKTPVELLNMLRTKAVFSEDQKAVIFSLKVEKVEKVEIDPFVAEMNAADEE